MSQFGSDELIGLALALVALAGLLALPVTLIVTRVLVRRFRGRVETSMSASESGAAGTPVPPAPGPPAPIGQPGTLEIAVSEATPGRAKAARRIPVLAEARKQARAVTVAYTVAASAQSLILAAVIFVAAPNADRSWQAEAIWFVALFLMTGTPALMAAAIVSTQRLKYMVIAVLSGLALFVLALLALEQTFDSPGSRVDIGGIVTWLWIPFAGIPAVFFVFLYARRVRAVGPVVFAALLLAFLGLGVGTVYSAMYGLERAGSPRFVREDLARLPLITAFERYAAEIVSLPLDRRIERIQALIDAPLEVVSVPHPEKFDRTGVRITFFAILLITPLLGAAAAWAVVRWIARSYRTGRASDRMLTMDVLLLIFALWVFLVLFSAFGGKAAIFAPAGFAAYKLVALWRLRRRPRSGASDPPRTLLLLRVFGFDKRTQGLLDQLARTWRYLGPIRLIGGPDLASTTIEPHEFFEFLNGRLSRAFIANERDLDERLRESRTEPDLDGLFRIEDFYCHDDTWRMTVSRLAREADAVLMDLRGFTPANRGCVHEIEQLLASVPLRRIALLVDETTDTVLLEHTARRAWSLMPADSPNAAPGVHRLRIVQASPRPRETLGTLLGQLCAPFEAAAPRPGA
jgi:hypothetical protein